MIIADVDCTAAGEPLCERFGVEGFPTIKSFAPPDAEGEDYDGGRDLDSLREFASSLGPSCSSATKESCDATQLAELEALLTTPVTELEAELNTLKTQLKSVQTAHDELVKSLQQQYEESEENVAKLKKELAPRMKMLRAATATSGPSADKDEV